MLLSEIGNHNKEKNYYEYTVSEKVYFNRGLINEKKEYQTRNTTVLSYRFYPSHSSSDYFSNVRAFCIDSNDESFELEIKNLDFMDIRKHAYCLALDFGYHKKKLKLMKKHKLEERLTVNDNVKQISDDIKNELLVRVKSSPTVMSKEFNRLLKKGFFTYYTNGKLPIESFKVKYYVTLYPNEKKYYEEIDSKVLNLNCVSDYENGFIELRLAMINNVLTRESYGSIEHEINHFLQNSLGQKKNENLYSKIQWQYNNGDMFAKRLAYALYLTFNTEISSFAVQYYIFLKGNKVPLEDVYYDFPNDEGNPYNDFSDYKYYIDCQKDKISDDYISSLFGISKKEYFNRLENADKRYRTKMMKAATRYRDELNENINRNTNLSTTKLARRLTFTVKCYNKGIIDEVSEFE